MGGRKETFLCSCESGPASKLSPPVFTFAALCQSESPLTGSTPWKEPVCNTAQQIESASQLKRHTYLIRPVIQGHALLPLHNTLSLFVTTAPQGSVKLLSFDLLQRKAGSTSRRCYPPPPPPFCRFLWENSSKVHITHIIINAYHVNALTANHSDHRGAGRRWAGEGGGGFKESLRIHPARDQRFSA